MNHSFNGHFVSTRLDHYPSFPNNTRIPLIKFNLMFNPVVLRYVFLLIWWQSKPNSIFKKVCNAVSQESQPISDLRIWCLPLNKEVEARTETPGYMQTVVLEALSQSHHKHSLVQDCSAFVPLLPLLHSWVVLKEKDTRNSNSMFLCMSKYTE